ncbi:MAG: tRNA (N6-isopentenyl adenosine(37)-C2)-methylthiotransferase MiaB [Ruminococcaceae bacterium]|nr:tRNA (N6-isopentenyl adenosine(37)-C2)-methylthiotransferase MiaB [Oscillospiraceae bacterium]
MHTADYISAIPELMRDRSLGEQPLAFIHTYGCQGNVSDGERIAGLLEAMGFGFTDDVNKADFILYNTCAVREHAEDRVFGNVGALKHVKRRNPNLIIALCGCMVQQQHITDRFKESYPYVNLIFGTHVIHRLPELLYRLLTGEKRVFELSQEDCTLHEDMPVRRDGRIRAWLPVMYGCNNFCTYCIVPYVRGRERSRDTDSIVREFEDIVKMGYRDITLLGQNVNSYGRSADCPARFPELLRTLDQTDGEYWLRFMTSHPKDCSMELLDAMKDCRHTARHLHLPFQSGSNEILQRMNRRYTRERYLELIAAARERMPDISITSDVIVGFPGETREQFEDTLSLIREVRFTSLFTFIYSPRKGTPAAEMEDGISAKEKSERMSELLRLQESIAAERCASMVDSVQRVLVEEQMSDGRLSCRTGGNIIIAADCAGDGAAYVGQFAEARVTAARNWTLAGELVTG